MIRTRAREWWLHRIGPRGREILHGGAWSLVSKLCSASNLLLSVPVVLASLGVTRFGIWATVVSLVSFAGFLDFGFGNGAMNLVAGARGRGSEREIASIVRAARRPLFGIALAVLIAGGSSVALLPLARWLHLPSVDDAEIRGCFAVLVVAVAAGIPLNLSTRVMLGLGSSAEAFRWQAVAQVATLVGLLVLALLDAGLVALVAVAVGLPLLGPVATTVLLRRRFPSEDAKPPAQLGHRIRHEGGLFFALQIAAALAFGLDLALITRLQGPEAAAGFSVLQRAFSLVPLTLGLVWTPLWPTYRHALAAGDRGWVVRTIRKSLLAAGALAALGATTIAFALLVVVPHLPVKNLHADPRLVAGLALWSVADAIGAAMSTFFNAASIVRYQVMVGAALAAACLMAKTWSIARWGAWSAPWATLAAYTVISLAPTMLMSRRLIDRALTVSHY